MPTHTAVLPSTADSTMPEEMKAHLVISPEEQVLTARPETD